MSHQCLDQLIPSRKLPEIKLAIFHMVNDLKEMISQKDNIMLQNIFDIYADQEVNDFIKEKMEVCDMQWH